MGSASSSPEGVVMMGGGEDSDSVVIEGAGESEGEMRGAGASGKEVGSEASKPHTAQENSRELHGRVERGSVSLGFGGGNQGGKELVVRTFLRACVARALGRPKNPLHLLPLRR